MEHSVLRAEFEEESMGKLKAANGKEGGVNDNKKVVYIVYKYRGQN